MRPVAISTVGKDYVLTNYGSFLQHYALRIVLKRLGFVPFRLIPEGEASSIFSMCVEQVRHWMFPLYWWLIKLPNRGEISLRMRTQDRTYWRFLRDYNKFIGKFDEKQLFGDTTIGIRGGDQVLNIGTDYGWLDSIKDGNPLITYAASTDWHRYGPRSDWRKFVAGKLSRFTAIGIREQVGVDIVQELVGAHIPVRHVADPVQLLLPDDIKMIQSRKRIFKKDTLFCYLLNVCSADDFRLSEYVRLAKRLGCDLKIVGIQGTESFVPKEYRAFYSPSQFLRALDDARYFITNSYHATVLAIQYRKNFLSVRQNAYPGQNQRPKELLHKFGLQSRWVDEQLSVEEWARVITTNVDWERVNTETETWRASSLMWLRSVLCKS